MMKSRSMKLSELRSKKTPVTDLFDDQHHEQIPGSRSRNRCVFGLMEERVGFPTGRKTDVRVAGHSETSILAQ